MIAETIKLVEASIVCMSLNVYHEARNEGVKGMMAVAEVTMNRVNSPKYPDNVCDVVKQGYKLGRVNCQFSWYCDGKSDAMNDDLWRAKAYQLAEYYLTTGFMSELTDGATHYHATYVHPHWASSFTPTAVIGDHIFYK